MGKLVRLGGNVKGWPSFRACSEGSLRDETEEEVCVFLVGEERLEGEGTVVGGYAQVLAREGEPRAQQGEVRGITPQGAAWAVL